VPIKWSAVRVSQNVDEAEQQVLLADQFITESKAKAKEARSIANLPQYMDDRLLRVITQFERMDNVKEAIKAVRNAIPDGAIEAEHESARHGTTQSLI